VYQYIYLNFLSYTQKIINTSAEYVVTLKLGIREFVDLTTRKNNNEKFPKDCGPLLSERS
jgi:hypothetical protein